MKQGVCRPYIGLKPNAQRERAKALLLSVEQVKSPSGHWPEKSRSGSVKLVEGVLSAERKEETREEAHRATLAKENNGFQVYSDRRTPDKEQ